MTGTLYITGDPEADHLLNVDGTALLIGMLLDQQVPMEWAFAGPATLRARLGHLDATQIAAMDQESFVAVCCEKPAIHRFPASMGRRIHEMCAALVADFGGRGEGVWDGVVTGAELYARLRTLPGYGEEKARIFVALLGKRMGVQPDGWRDAAAKFFVQFPQQPLGQKLARGEPLVAPGASAAGDGAVTKADAARIIEAVPVIEPRHERLADAPGA